jgi:hypothetical protein
VFHKQRLTFRQRAGEIAPPFPQPVILNLFQDLKNIEVIPKDILMQDDLLNTPQKQPREEHPSIAERKKLEKARKLRLTQALRNNLKKRKEQVRGRKNSIVQKESSEG